MQVHQGQHLGDLGRLAGPWRQDRAAEADPFAGLLVDPAVVDPGGPDLDGSRSGHQRPGKRVPIAHDHTMPVLVPLVSEGRHVGVDLGLEGCGQHPPGPLGHQLVQRGRQLRVRDLLNMYSQHWRSFLPAFHRQRPFGLVKEEGTPRLQSGGASTSFGYNSRMDRGLLQPVTAPQRLGLPDAHRIRGLTLRKSPGRILITAVHPTGSTAFGGGDGIRTHGLYIANVWLSVF